MDICSFPLPRSDSIRIPRWPLYSLAHISLAWIQIWKAGWHQKGCSNGKEQDRNTILEISTIGKHKYCTYGFSSIYENPRTTIQPPAIAADPANRGSIPIKTNGFPVMKKKLSVFAFILMPFIYSCVHTNCIKKETANKYKKFLAVEFAKSGWNFELNHNDSVAYIKNEFGPPISETIKKVKNLHDAQQIDQIHILNYAGLEVHVYHVNTIDLYDFLIQVNITNSDTYPIKYGINIGSDLSYILDILGSPSKVNNGVLIYQTKEGDTYPTVSMFFEEDKLKEIQWEWLPD